MAARNDDRLSRVLSLLDRGGSRGGGRHNWGSCGRWDLRGAASLAIPIGRHSVGSLDLAVRDLRNDRSRSVSLESWDSSDSASHEGSDSN